MKDECGIWVLAGWLAVLAGGCVPPGAGAGAGTGTGTGTGAGAGVGAVVVVSVDGLRADAVAGARTLVRLQGEGSHSLEAQTVVPSLTLPSHVSMLTGVGPEVHGITWNENRTGRTGPVAVATVFEIARGAGLETAAFFSKSKFRHLLRPGSLDRVELPRGAEYWPAGRTVGAAVDHLRFRRPQLLFVHIGEPDYAGHAFGWSGRVYRWAVRRADAGVARLIEAADAAYGAGHYTLIVTSDHGGEGRRHGGETAAERTIPWLAWGRGVPAGVVLEPGIRTMDTAATVLCLLGLPVPAEWEGRPVAGVAPAACAVR
jgi:arylsulfatase A-like enzyme